MYGHVIPMVVDVDRAEDIALAEALERAALVMDPGRGGGSR